MTKRTEMGTDRVELVATFLRIAETGSLSAAARWLGTTQPTVSRRLQMLESWFGLKLVQRTTHAMSLTEDGERFFARAKNLLEDWNALEEEVRGSRMTPTGHLRVVVPHAFGQEQMIAPLSDYMRNYPEVSVEWILHDLHPNFTTDGIDCAVQLGAAEDPNTVAIQLAEVGRIVVAPPALCDRPPRAPGGPSSAAGCARRCRRPRRPSAAARRPAEPLRCLGPRSGDLRGRSFVLALVLVEDRLDFF